MSQLWGGLDCLCQKERNAITSSLEITPTVKPPRAEECEITRVKQAKESWEASHQKEEIMTGMMTERKVGEEAWRGGALMDPNRRLEDVYMFVLQVSWSRSLCALTWPRQNAFIGASWGRPWEHAVCQHTQTPHCWAHSPPRKRHRKRAIPTLAEPPPLGSDLDRHWRLSAVQKRRNYHKYAFPLPQ